MANWVTIENGEITGYYDLVPANWQHVSGLDLSQDDLPFLKSLGWFPVVRQDPGTYDINLYELGSFNYEIQEDSVLEIPVITARSAPLIPDVGVLKSNFMDNLRSTRNRLLSESDYTQLADMQARLDTQVKYNLTMYRQALRDLPDIYASQDILDVGAIVWPAFPDLTPPASPGE